MNIGRVSVKERETQESPIIVPLQTYNLVPFTYERILRDNTSVCHGMALWVTRLDKEKDSKERLHVTYPKHSFRALTRGFKGLNNQICQASIWEGA